MLQPFRRAFEKLGIYNNVKTEGLDEKFPIGLIITVEVSLLHQNKVIAFLSDKNHKLV